MGDLILGVNTLNTLPLFSKLFTMGKFSAHTNLHSVDNGSVAEECGLRVGDQVLDVNGHSFVNIIHAEAVTILRSYPTFIMTVKVFICAKL